MKERAWSHNKSSMTRHYVSERHAEPRRCNYGHRVVTGSIATMDTVKTDVCNQRDSTMLVSNKMPQ